MKKLDRQFTSASSTQISAATERQKIQNQVQLQLDQIINRYTSGAELKSSRTAQEREPTLSDQEDLKRQFREQLSRDGRIMNASKSTSSLQSGAANASNP